MPVFRDFKEQQLSAIYHSFAFRLRIVLNELTHDSICLIYIGGNLEVTALDGNEWLELFVGSDDNWDWLG